jgi:hypothetical protein
LFLLASEVKRDLWQSKFKNEKLRDVTLAEYLLGFLTHPKTAPMSSLSNTLMSTVGIDKELVPTQVLLNFASCFVKSKAYQKSKQSQKT